MLTSSHNNSFLYCFIIPSDVRIERDKFGLILHPPKANSDRLAVGGASLGRRQRRECPIHLAGPQYEESSAQLSWDFQNKFEAVVICRVVSHTEWPITLSRYFSI
jgi:hypothetical protein